MTTKIIETDNSIQPMTIEVSPEDIIRGISSLQNIPGVSNVMNLLQGALANADIEVQIEVEVEGE